MRGQITRAERQLVADSFRNIYHGAQKFLASQIELGSAILVRIVDEHCTDEEDAMYQVLIVYRKSKNVIRCASMLDDQMDESYEISPLDMVVPLGGVRQCVKQEPKVDPVTAQDKADKLRLSVSLRTNKVVLFADPKDEDNRVYYLTQVRHNKYGQPTSGIVENGGWRIRFDGKGSVFIGGNRARDALFQTEQISLLYVPKEVTDKVRRDAAYETILPWARRIPKEYRTVFKFEEGKVAYPLTVQSVES